MRHCHATLSCRTEPEQRIHNYETTTGGSVQVVKWRAPMGPALRKYAIYVAQSVFGDVQVLEGQPPRDNVKLLLVPRVAQLGLPDNRFAGGLLNPVPDPFGSGRCVIGAMSIQWDFNDPKTAQTLFSTRVRCESRTALAVVSTGLREFLMWPTV